MVKKKISVKAKTVKEGSSESRRATGIPGFDSSCEGGFIGDSLNLVIGNAGAGKTTFLLHFLYNGAVKYKEAGLYVSFEPEIKDLQRAGKRQGMDFEGVDDVHFLRLTTDMATRDIQERVAEHIKKYRVTRVCIDPLNILAVELPNRGSARKQIYELAHFFKDMGVCVIFAGEADEETNEGQSLTEDIAFAKYLVDGVVELYSSGLGGEGDRALRISKMRMTNHFRGPIGMKIDNKGINLFKK